MNSTGLVGNMQHFETTTNSILPINQFDPNAPPPLPMQPQFDASAILAEITSLNQQIADSEANLRAQYESIEIQKEVVFV